MRLGVDVAVDDHQQDGGEQHGEESGGKGGQAGQEGGGVDGADLPEGGGHCEEEGGQAGEEGYGPGRADQDRGDGSCHVVVVAEGPQDCQVLVVGHQQGGEEGQGGHHLTHRLRELALEGDQPCGEAVQGNEGEEQHERGDVHQEQVDYQRVRGGPQRFLPGKDEQQGEVDQEGEEEEKEQEDQFHKKKQFVTIFRVSCHLHNSHGLPQKPNVQDSTQKSRVNSNKHVYVMSLPLKLPVHVYVIR